MSNQNKESFWKKTIDLTGNAVMLNLLFLVSAIPLVTAGPALCGLYTAVRYMIRGDRWFDGFKDGFRTRFWRKLLVGILAFVAGVAMLINLIPMIFYQQEGYIGPMIMTAIITALTLMIASGLLITEVYIPTGFVQWLRNGVTMAVTAPLVTLVGAIFIWSPVLIFILLMEIFYIFAIVFLTVYFPMGTLISTILWKNKLIRMKKENAEFLLDQNENAENTEEDEENEQ